MTSDKATYYIGISSLDKLPDDLLLGSIHEIKAPGLIISIRKRPAEAYAAFEWIVPTACVTYIAKSYFDGFLKEVGKDHITSLKTWLKKL